LSRDDLRRIGACADRIVVGGYVEFSKQFARQRFEIYACGDLMPSQNPPDDRPTIATGALRSDCPQCGARARVVTAVTIRALGNEPRQVLVTFQCTATHCMFKYPLLKSETDLSDEEREAWR
jgi:hypothetical protein